MGGAVSRLDETDWQQADGGMRKSPVHASALPSHNQHGPCFDSTTLDGRPPTIAYNTYSLLKHSVLAQQRCLDVTDNHANLLYEIRPTPHTLTAFDVYDGATQRHLLRITTDLARRYWIVCRVGIPVYDGQAEEPMVMDNEEEGDATGDDQDFVVEEEKKQYFKVACVTVSWSRYMAVAAYYGSPTGEQVATYTRQQEELMLEQQAIANRRSHSSSCDDLSSVVENENIEGGGVEDLRATSSESTPKTTLSLDEEIPTSGVTRCSDEKKTDLCDLSSSSAGRVDLSLASTDGSSPRSEPGHFNLEQVDSNESDALQSSNSMPELQQFTSWFQKTSRGLQKQIVAQQDQIYTTGKDYLQKRSLKLKATALQDPQRGVIHLDKPLLLCQEIYNKFIGNHQTSRVSKQRVIQLLRQDMEQHLQQQESSGDQPATAAVTTMDDISETIQKEEEEAENNNPLAHAVVEDNDDDTPSANNNAEQQQPPPLVGYWHWEHTLRTHKMKMHVAKGTDLALHVVMAVLVNQVRYERNAIAMTV